MLRSVIILSCLFLFTSCRNNSPEEFTHYYEDGRAKPVVAIAPIIDSTMNNFSWSLSDEFKSLILNRASKKGSLFIKDDHENFIPSSENPFSEDISWVKKEYAPFEFVVFLELMEHDKVPIKKTNYHANTSSNLNISFRIRVIDIRSNEPKIVLQEVVNDSFFEARNIIQPDYDLNSWGTDAYHATPMSTAHTKITREVVERINDYILLAKSRWNG